MEQTAKRKLQELTGGRIKWDYPLGKHTTFKAGGNATAFYEVENVDNLGRLLEFLQREDIPYLVVGKGSNLLITDDGYDGIAIRLAGSLAEIKRPTNGETSVEAGAGAAVWELLRFCKEEGLAGVEFLAGIPGTVGGVIAMNAGAFGHEISGLLRWIEIMAPDGRLKKMHREELSFSYRNMDSDPGSIITNACFLMEPGEPSQISETITQYLVKRKKSQPLEYPSAGSVFKNPPGLYAGGLIEECGLKGTKVGDAMVSMLHANFIVNTGSAKATDIIRLIHLVREKVKEKHGIDLELELTIVGK